LKAFEDVDGKLSSCLKNLRELSFFGVFKDWNLRLLRGRWTIFEGQGIIG